MKILKCSSKFECPQYGDEEIARRCPHFWRLRHLLCDPITNLLLRKYFLEQAQDDLRVQAALNRMCSEDPLFWLSVFIWTLAPKQKWLDRYSIIPFAPYPFQVHYFLALLDIMQKRGIAIGFVGGATLKSRDMGASWLHLMAALWLWKYADAPTGMMMSRVEDLVDDKANPKALFPKIDHAYRNLPEFMRPVRTRTHMKMVLEKNGAILHGMSTTGYAGNALRDDFQIFDEFDLVEASMQHAIFRGTRDASDARLFLSTLTPEQGAFKLILKNKKFIQFRIHWSAHPIKNRGAYTWEGERLVLVDIDYWLAKANALRPEGAEKYTAASLSALTVDQARDACQYNFEYDAIRGWNWRSPWFDDQCAAANHLNEIAADLEMEDGAEGGQFFDERLIVRVLTQSMRPPAFIGRIEFDADTADRPRFVPCLNGPLHLWCSLDESGRPMRDRDGRPLGRFAGFADVSAGSGASNSSLAMADRYTGEQVAEFTDSRIRAFEFGKVCVAMAKFFWGDDNRGALLGWESNAGPGQNFTDSVYDELRYTNVYWKNEDHILGKRRDRDPDERPGLNTTGAVKATLGESYRRMLADGDIVVRSERALQEHRGYRVRGNTIEFETTGMGDDPSGAGNWHGDRVIALIGLAHLLRVFEIRRKSVTAPAAPNPHSLRARIARAARRAELDASTRGYWH